MLKTLLGALNPWKYAILAVAIASLLSWHYGSIYFAKKAGKTEQKQETIDAVSVLINKQVKTNEKIKNDVDKSNIDDLRAGVLKRSRPRYSALPASTRPDQLQHGSGGSDGRQSNTRCRETQQSVQSTYKRLCRSAGCEKACRSISFDAEFGVIGDCKP